MRRPRTLAELKRRVLDCVLTYESVGATTSELSDELLLPLERIEFFIQQLSDGGLLVKNGRKRHFGKRGGASPDIWVGSDFFGGRVVNL